MMAKLSGEIGKAIEEFDVKLGEMLKYLEIWNPRNQ